MTYREEIPEINAIYHSARWKKVRKLKIARVNGLCERCLKKRIFREGKIVHHKIHLTEDNWFDENVVYNLDNLEFLCAECHLEEHQNHKDYIFDSNGDLIGN